MSKGELYANKEWDLISAAEGDDLCTAFSRLGCARGELLTVLDATVMQSPGYPTTTDYKEEVALADDLFDLMRKHKRTVLRRARWAAKQRGDLA